MNLAADFASIRGEMRDAPALRTVAAMNPECSKAEFVAAAVAAGYPRHAAGARFGESRRVSMECGEMFDAEGRQLPSNV